MIFTSTHSPFSQLAISAVDLSISMRKLHVICTSCLALRGLLFSDVEAFAISTFRSSLDRLSHRSARTDLHHAHSYKNICRRSPSAIQQQGQTRQQQQRHPSAQGRGAVTTTINMLPSRDSNDNAETETAGNEVKGAKVSTAGVPAQAFFRTLLTSIMALSVLAAISTASPLLGTVALREAHADDSAITGSTLTVDSSILSSQEVVLPAWRPVLAPRRKAQPPPEIPPGRITLAQWFSRYASRIRVKSSSWSDRVSSDVTVVKRDMTSVPTALPDFAALAEKMKQELAGKAAGEMGNGSSGGLKADVGVDLSNSVAEAPAENTALEATSANSLKQDMVDALKEEILNPPAPTEQRQTDSRRKAPTGLDIPDAPVSLSQLFSSSSRENYNVGELLSTTREGKVAENSAAISSAADISTVPEIPKPRAKRPKLERSRAGNRDQSGVVDLSSELRAEAVKSSSSAPVRALRKGLTGRNGDQKTLTSSVFSPLVVKGRTVPQTDPRTSLEASSSLKMQPIPTVESDESKTALKGEAVRGSGEGRGVVGGDGSSSVAVAIRMEEAAATAKASLDALDFAGASEQAKDTAAQVEGLAADGGRAAAAGFSAMVEQSRAKIEYLQAEANRISADLGETAAPIAEKLSTGASALPEATTGGFASVTERFASVADRLKSIDVSGGLARVKDTGGKFSEAVERGTDGAVSKLKGAGKTVGDGLTGVASATAGRASGVAGSLRDVVPDVQAGASAFSSQVSGVASRAASQAGQLSGRVSDSVMKISAPELQLGQAAEAARSTLARFSESALGSFSGDGVTTRTAEARKFIAKVRSTAAGVLGGSSDNLIGDGEQDLEFVAGAAVLSTALLAARGARSKARGGEVAGERGVTEFEDRPLQRIGVSKEAAEATGAGQAASYSAGTVAATGALWDMIRDSGTGAGDAVREVSQEDLLARAAEVAGQLRDTAEGLEILKTEVIALRRSIRDPDLEGKAKALREGLAAALEGDGLGIDHTCC